jgi:hypothetical protein
MTLATNNESSSAPATRAPENEPPVEESEYSSPPLPIDVLAAMKVLGRRDRSQDRPDTRLRLQRTDLRRLVLLRGEWHLENAELYGAHLEDAFLPGARLEGAILNKAHLQRAELIEAHLDHAMLQQAHLEDAKFHGAHLEWAHLEGARLDGANLADAHLEDATLSHARLDGATLHGVHLEHASLRHPHRAVLRSKDQPWRGGQVAPRPREWRRGPERWPCDEVADRGRFAPRRASERETVFAMR